MGEQYRHNVREVNTKAHEVYDKDENFESLEYFENKAVILLKPLAMANPEVRGEGDCAKVAVHRTFCSNERKCFS